MKDFIVKEYKVATTSFETTVKSSQAPMVPCRDHGNLPPVLWGGADDRPVFVNKEGEFKTRQDLEDIYETQPYYDLIMGGYRKIVYFAQTCAEAVEELEVWQNDPDHTAVYHIEFTPHADKDRVYSPILDEDEVIEVHERDFMGRSMKILVPHEEISPEGDDDGTYVCYVVFDNATYRAIIHERDL